MVVARAFALLACTLALAACGTSASDAADHACADGKKDCANACVGADCTNPNAPSHSDGVKNSGETGIDCGGSVKADKPCPEGQTCIDSTDCAGTCTNGTCGPTGPQDGKKNGGETDVDCGGPNAPKCAEGKGCQADGDCTTTYCKADTKICTVPRPDDGVKNADETDVDCGGKVAPKCAVGKACLAHSDCDDGCGEASHVCVNGKSCVKHDGGDTCGGGEDAKGNCCETAALANSTVKIDKYFVTAGRMRAMIERLKGDVRTFVQGLPADKWNQAWNALVPSNVDEANMMLGSYWADAPNDSDGNNSKRSCAPGDYNGRTYWMPRINGPDNTTDADDDYSDFNQAQLDVKALNCVGWHLSHAFCVWDGGRMAKSGEVANAYTNGGTTSYPWGNDGVVPQDDRLNHLFNYGYPDPKDVPNMRFSGEDALDIAWHVSPPGRFPLGNNQNGVADMAGDVMHWVADGEYGFDWTFSWETHDGYPVHGGAGANFTVDSWQGHWPGEPNGYYAIGIRCAHD
jgi:formylglycine-generating enzyme required for sulfatase activity